MSSAGARNFRSGRNRPGACQAPRGPVGRAAWRAQGAYVVVVEPCEPHAAEAISGTTPARIATIALGYLLLAAGAVLLFLPGPGVPLILAGLAVVGRQQHWARRLEGRLRLRAASVARRLTARRS